MTVTDTGAGVPTTAAVTGLANGTAHDVTVVATNAIGTGSASGTRRRHTPHRPRARPPP